MNISWWQRFLSYFFLVTVRKIPSDINPGLCVQMEAGKLLLNTRNANYSYGNLHLAFEEVFGLMELEKHLPEKVLLLGLGTGSVIDILQRQFGCDPWITAVEADQAVVDCLPFWDQLQLHRTRILVEDAFDTVKNLDADFDLIIVDLFQDLEVVSGIYQEDFHKDLKRLLKPDGSILLNFILSNKKQKEQFAELQIALMKHFKEIKGYEVMQINRMLELKTA